MKWKLLIVCMIAGLACWAQHSHFFSGNYSFVEEWNPRDKWTHITLSDGFVICQNSGGYGLVRATIGVSSSSVNTKVYWEDSVISYSNYANLGIANSSEVTTASCGATANGWGYVADPGMGGGAPVSFVLHNNAYVSFGGLYSAGDIVGFYLDMTADTCGVFKATPPGSMVYQGQLASGLSGTIFPCASTYSGNVFVYKAHFTSASFTYTPHGSFTEIHR